MGEEGAGSDGRHPIFFPLLLLQINPLPLLSVNLEPEERILIKALSAGMCAIVVEGNAPDRAATLSHGPKLGQRATHSPE